MTHEELCERAKRWLSGTRRCKPVFSRCASCAEVPDAIGWSRAGSTVIEVKTSVSDFYADLKKGFVWKHPEFEGMWHPGARISTKRALRDGYVKHPSELMGDYRFYFCEDGVLSEKLVEEKAPDHGLLYKCGCRVAIIRAAPRRTLVDKDSEIRFLRFAIINGKVPHELPKPSRQPELFSTV